MNLFTRKAASVAALTVLGITAGGIAWAESASTPATTAAATSATTAAGAAAPDANGAGGRMRGLGRHVLHGEVVLQTRKGIVTADIARGTVSAIDGDSISVKSADGVVTTFTINANTKARSAGHVIPLNTVHAGDQVGVLGIKTGADAPVARMIRKLPASADNT